MGLLQHQTAEGAPKEWDFFVSQGQAAISLPRCLVWALPCHWQCWWDLCEQLHVSVSDCGSSLWLREESQESGFLAEDVMSTWACVWEEMGCQALGCSLEQSPKAFKTIYVFCKKLRPNFSKRWRFFSQPQYTHSFRFWPGSFSLVATNLMILLSKKGARGENTQFRAYTLKPGNRRWRSWLRIVNFGWGRRPTMWV